MVVAFRAPLRPGAGLGRISATLGSAALLVCPKELFMRLGWFGKRPQAAYAEKLRGEARAPVREVLVRRFCVALFRLPPVHVALAASRVGRLRQVRGAP